MIGRMTEHRFCPKCGAALPPGANYCPICGATSGTVTPPPAAPMRRSTYWIWVPIAVIALALLAWAVLSGLPFGREPQQPIRARPEVVVEGPPSTETVPRLGEGDAQGQRPPLLEVEAPEVQQPERPAHEISEAEALDSLRSYIVSRDDYGVASRCLSISSLGYRNAGYGFEAFDRCSGRPLGRWRVDSEDASGIFLQRRDGRYLRP